MAETDSGRYYKEGGYRALDYLNKFRPKDKLRGIGQESLEDFARGVGVIWKIVEYEDPDYIFVPARGALPLVWSLEEAARREGKSLPVIVVLPIGSHTDIYNAEEAGGITKPEKDAIIKSHLATARELSPQGINKIMLLDEARTGGTIAKAAEYLNTELRASNARNGEATELVTVVAFDKRYEVPTESKRFGKLMAGRFGRTHKVTLDMPFMDKNQILPMILKQDPEVRQNEAAFRRHELLEFVDNPKARELTQLITGKTFDGIENWEEDCRCTADEIIKGK